LTFITVVESVYSAVRTDSLHKADFFQSLKGLHTRTITDHLRTIQYVPAESTRTPLRTPQFHNTCLRTYQWTPRSDSST